MRTGLYALLTAATLLSPAVLARAGDDLVYQTDDGQIRVRPRPVEARLNNPWPEAWEQAFWQRANHAIKHYADVKVGHNTWGENEKSTYPHAMWAFLNGRRDEALTSLQRPDSQPKDHAHTLGIDYFWCFTLKGQMRKYFLFGPYLEPDYRERMKKGAANWLETDPATTPHPVHGTGTWAYGYGPEQRGYQVDLRNTDNLRAMRDTSIYLMAEETRNEPLRLLYKEKIRHYVQTLYNIGMHEWDSPNYHGHTLAPYHNLYDFARDADTKLLAKAALDWLYAAGAVKYWRGAMGGPCAREYGKGYVVWGPGASHPLGLYFGDGFIEDPDPHYDDVHHITSAYRPPAAVVEMARKRFERPVELLATKPHYRNWQPGMPSEPRYFETQFFGRTFQMGSVTSEKHEVIWDVSPFKLMAHNSKRGVDYFVAFTVTPDETANLWAHGGKNEGDQIGQHRNLMIWLRPARPVRDNPMPPFQFVVPATASVELDNEVWFVAYEKTYLAIWPLNLAAPTEVTYEKTPAIYQHERFHQSDVTGKSFAGFALEVGEQPDYESFDAFKQAVRAKSRLDRSKLDNGIVELQGADGRTLKIDHSHTTELPTVWRNGVKHAWFRDHLDVYRPVGGDLPIRQDYRSGTLTVQAGGRFFTCTVTDEGEVTFRNENASASSAELPKDNPVAAHYRATPDVMPAWVDDLPWQKVVSIADFGGESDDERYTAACEKLREQGGGVLYFPPGTYRFSNHLELPDGVILRGAAPAGHADAKSPAYRLPTRFEFPKYQPTFEGAGTPIDTAFKGIRLPSSASSAGVVNIAINRGHIYFPEAEDHKTGENRLVFGCMLTNTAIADANVPDPRYGHKPHQRWTARHHAAITIYSGQNAFVANNRIPESGDDNFVVPDYTLLHPRGNAQQFRLGQSAETVTIESGVVFDYDNRPGIYVNGFGMAGATPDTHPWGFRKGTIIRDNYIYCTGRSAIHFTGDGVLCAANTIRFPRGIWRPTCTGRTTSDGSSTNDNRALTMRGYRWRAIGNDYIVHPNIAYDKRTYINDAEGIMHERHANSILKDGQIIGNTGNRYLCIWATDVNGLVIRGNRVGDDGDPAIHILGRDSFVRHVVIEGNQVYEGAIQVTAGEPGDIVIRDNVWVGPGTGKVRVEDRSWAKQNHGFEVELKQPRR